MINRTGSQADSKSEIRFAKNNEARFAFGVDLHNDGQQNLFIWDHQALAATGGAGLARFILNGKGKIGIGMDPPMSDCIYRLFVDGGIMTRDVKVKNNGWCDFVFKKDYPLPDLYQLEAQIDSLGHLPGIPSAEQIEADNGYEVGEMVQLLLQKLEEQTLHIIRMQKEIDALKAGR